MLAKVSVKVSTFILVIIIIDRREVRDEYPSFFCALWFFKHNRLLTIGVS